MHPPSAPGPTQVPEWGSNSLHSLAFQANQQPMWIVSRDTRIVQEANRAAVHRFGYSADEWFGMRFPIYPESTDFDLPTLDGDGCFSGTAGMRAKDGSTVAVSLRSMPFGTGPKGLLLVVAEEGSTAPPAGPTDPLAALSAIIDVLPIGVCCCDAEGFITAYNRQAVRLWGRDPAEHGHGPSSPERFCGSLRLYRSDGNPMPHVSCPMAEVLRTGGPVTDREVIIERPDGGRSYALISVAPLRNPDGELTGAINCFLDITMRRQAQEALRRESAENATARKNLARLASFPALNPNPVAELDIRGHIRYLNPECRREFPDMETTGVSHPFLAGIFDAVVPGSEEPVHTVQEVHVGQRIYERRSSCFPREGRIVVYGTDLTTRMRTAEALAASERRFRTLLEQAADAIFVIDETGRFLDVNQRACASLGYTRAELLQMSIPEVSVELSASDVLTGWEHVVSKTGATTIEGTHRRKDGSVFPVEVSVGGIELDGRLVMVALARDITVRKSLEAELRQAQRLEAVGRLAGGIAHDFNNLLTVILGSSDLLLHTWDPAVEGREDIEEIQKAALRAASLTHQLLAFSRRQVLKPEAIELNSTVSEMASLLQRLIGEDVELRVELTEDLGTVRADSGQLEQVITNLVVNARDAMPKGGVLTIATGNLRIEEGGSALPAELSPGSYVTLAVSDTGVGMEEGVQAHVFEPFFTTKSRDHGTGLGLATVYGIVAQSGGQISVESEVGAGTTFTIYFPEATTPSPVRASHTPPATPTGGSETILVVEDETGVRDLIVKILEAKGYRVLSAEDGVAALEVAGGHYGRIDLLLTDVVLPGIRGHELAQRLLVQSPDTRVAYLSGYTDDEIVKHGVRDARFAFLQKPFSAEALNRLVRGVLDGSEPAANRVG